MEFEDMLIEQIKIVRDSGACNMLDANAVITEAVCRNCFELASYIETDRERYFKFIMNGNKEVL